MCRAVLRVFLVVGLLLSPVWARAGVLSPVGVVSGLPGVTALAVSADGANVYAATRENDAVHVYGRDASTGLLTKVQTISAAAGAVGVFDVNSIALSADGKHAYLAYRKSFTPYAEGVSVWARDTGTGTLSFVEVQKEGVGGVTGLDHVSSVIISADGAHVYGRGRSGDDAAIAGFTRNATTGALTFLGATTFVSENRGRNQGIALAPNGAHLYAVGDNAVLAFARDGGTGALTHVSTAENGVGGVTGLNDPENLTVSGDGANVYVAAIGTYASGHNHDLTVLARDSGTGALTYVEKHFEPRPLRGPNGVVVDGSGTRVFFTAARMGDAVTGVYSRDGGTGALTLLTYEGGKDTYESRGALAVSPDDAHLYVIDAYASAIRIFDIRCGTGTLDAGEACDDGNSVSGDGCSFCYVDPCWACSGVPSVCGHDDGTPCDDGTICTTADTCAGGDCVGTPDDGIPCDDFQACTINDTCFGGGCGGSVEPDPNCHQPTEAAGSSLKIFHNQDDVYDSSLQWKWKKGEATTLAELGDPVNGTTSYTTCIYQQPGPGDPALIVARNAYAGCSGASCWKATSRGFKLKSRETSITLKSGPQGKAAVAVDLKQLPWELGTLPLATPVIVQLKAWHWSGSGNPIDACWSATFSAPARNDASKFKAASD